MKRPPVNGAERPALNVGAEAVRNALALPPNKFPFLAGAKFAQLPRPQEGFQLTMQFARSLVEGREVTLTLTAGTSAKEAAMHLRDLAGHIDKLDAECAQDRAQAAQIKPKGLIDLSAANDSAEAAQDDPQGESKPRSIS